MDKYGTKQQKQNEEFRKHWVGCPNLITRYVHDVS